METFETEVLIVGAGPTGLVLAADLHRRGIPFQIIDRAARPSQEPRSTSLQKSTLAIFSKLGLLRHILNGGLIIKGVRTYQEKRLSDRFELETSSTSVSQIPYLLTTEQHQPESVLLTHLASEGIHVKFDQELVRLENEPESVLSWVSDSNGKTQLITSRYVVGCDGCRSSVRSLSRIPMKGSNLRVVYRFAEAEASWDLPPDEIIRFPKDDWEMVAIPLPGGRYRLNIWEPAPYSPHLGGKLDHGTVGEPLDLNELESRLRALAPGPLKLHNPGPPVSYRVSFGVAKNYCKDRILLAGDAAHLIPQSAAQGLNLGVQDVHNLGWRLASVLKGQAPLEVLNKYEAERRQVALRILLELRADRASNKRLTYLSSRENLDRWSQLRLNYRSNAYHLDFSSRSTVLAGDRAPNGTLPLDQQRVCFDSLLTGHQHHLLIFMAREDSSLERILTLIKEQYLVRLQYTLISTSDVSVDGLPALYNAVHGDLVLIRPDGFIELRASLAQADKFLVHLAHIFNMTEREEARLNF